MPPVREFGGHDTSMIRTNRCVPQTATSEGDKCSVPGMAVADRRAIRYKKVEVNMGSYASKGLYRPQIYCLMISNPKDEFCQVCQRAMAQMIDYFAGTN